MTPEGRVKEQVKRLLKKYGVYYFMPLGQSFGRAGVPDFVCCFDGHFFGVETKAGKGKCTALQKVEHDLIRQAGGIVLVIRETNLNELEEYVSGIAASSSSSGTE